MSFSVRPFRRLQWQLSLSYTLVAAGALLVVELVLLGLLLVLMNSDVLPTLLVRSFGQQLAPNLRQFLDRPEPDLKGLDRYLSIYATGVEQKAEDPPDGQIWTASEGQEQMLVIDPQRRLLWAQRPDQFSPVGSPLDTALIPGAEQVIPAALDNAGDLTRLYTRSGNLLVMAIPITSEDEQRVLGAMIFTLSMPSFTNPDFLLQILPTILISLLLFTLAAGLVGSVFGYFTAHRLTRRLGHVSHAADAWSRGNFTTFIQDSTGDELGELSRRLNAMAEQLQNLLHTRQDLAALEERNRIARELHDSVKQQVFATAMQLGAARALLGDDASPAGQRLAEAERLTRQAQNELTALIRELRPVALEGKGLARALRELASDWSRQTGIPAQVEVSAGQTAPLPLLKEQALYRVTQEALANIARHSQARSVRVSFTRDNGSARLTIQDDGMGFDPTEAQGKGLGLRSMRERVEALGGRLEIETAASQGTRLIVAIPVEDAKVNGG